MLTKTWHFPRFHACLNVPISPHEFVRVVTEPRAARMKDKRSRTQWSYTKLSDLGVMVMDWAWTMQATVPQIDPVDYTKEEREKYKRLMLWLAYFFQHKSDPEIRAQIKSGEELPNIENWEYFQDDFPYLMYEALERFLRNYKRKHFYTLQGLYSASGFHIYGEDSYFRNCVRVERFLAETPFPFPASQDGGKNVVHPK